jgi:hypothetical protein
MEIGPAMGFRSGLHGFVAQATLQRAAWPVVHVACEAHATYDSWWSGIKPAGTVGQLGFPNHTPRSSAAAPPFRSTHAA